MQATAPSTNLRTPPSIIATIIGISAVASLFLAWLVYYHPPVDVAGTRLAFLPALDAVLNALCAIFLVIGFRYIRRREIIKHRNSMFGAFIVSTVFLVAYVVNHVLHGDMLFPRAYPTARFMKNFIPSLQKNAVIRRSATTTTGSSMCGAPGVRAARIPSAT